MTSIDVAPIVEGHGEVEAIRTLLTRIAAEFAPACTMNVLKPIRVSKSKIIRDKAELLRAIDFAVLRLRESPNAVRLVLLLIDADDDAACQLAPALIGIVKSERAHIDFSCVIAVVEFETWLVAGADSLSDLLVPGFHSRVPADPESQRVGKGWIEEFFHGTKYSESVDQVRLTARFDVKGARGRSASFDKLCREVEAKCS